MRLTELFIDFFNSKKAGGIILIACTVVSLLLANSALAEQYRSVWEFTIGHHTVAHWINDGLMTIFFLLVGLELEREVYAGELSTLKKAALPTVAAAGGMLVPAAIFMMFNAGSAAQPGAGIPMATDIAFAIGVLSLLGNRVPASVKVLLTALAVIDDLGAILVIAIFYTDSLSFANLALAFGSMGILFVFNRFKVHNAIPYILGGIAMWYFMLQSGVHATLAGVLLAFVIPFGTGGENTLSYRMQQVLHKPVNFVVLPLFALANTCIVMNADGMNALFSMNSTGVYLGLVVGKPLGIFLFSTVAIALGICAMPQGIQRKHILGVGLLAGIGFTMSIFITLLAFNDATLITQAKMAILAASLTSALLGYGYLDRILQARPEAPQQPASTN